MQSRVEKRIEDLRRDYCNPSCSLYGTNQSDEGLTIDEMEDCRKCYNAALKGSYHFSMIRKYRIEGT